MPFETPTLPEHHFLEAFREIQDWKSDSLDPFQHDLAVHINPDEIRGEIADLIDTFCHSFNPKNPQEFHGPDSLEDQFSILQNLEEGINQYEPDNCNDSEVNSLDFMRHYLAHELMRIKLEMRKLKKLAA